MNLLESLPPALGLSTPPNGSGSSAATPASPNLSLPFEKILQQLTPSGAAQPAILNVTGNSMAPVTPLGLISPHTPESKTAPPQANPAQPANVLPSLAKLAPKLDLPRHPDVVLDFISVECPATAPPSAWLSEGSLSAATDSTTSTDTAIAAICPAGPAPTADSTPAKEAADDRSTAVEIEIVPPFVFVECPSVVPATVVPAETCPASPSPAELPVPQVTTGLQAGGDAATSSTAPGDVLIAVECPAAPSPEDTATTPGVSPAQEELARLLETLDVRQLKYTAAPERAAGLSRGEVPAMVRSLKQELATSPTSPSGAAVAKPVLGQSLSAAIHDALGISPKSDNKPPVMTEWKGEPITSTLQEALDVRRIAQKAGQELNAAKANWIRIPVASDAPAGNGHRESHSAAKPKVSEGGVEVFTSSVLSGDRRPEAALAVVAPEAVQRVRERFEPPAPPPVARQVSIEVGDADSQVNIVIRERNGDLAIQFGAATERLRESLQQAAPLLLHQLQRDGSPAPAVQLDFSSFGSATDAGRDSHQDSRGQKPLKSEADFAALEEVAELTGGAEIHKTLEILQLAGRRTSAPRLRVSRTGGEA